MKLETRKGRYGSVEVVEPLAWSVSVDGQGNESPGDSHIIIATFWHTGEDGEAEKNAARFIAMKEEA